MFENLIESKQKSQRTHGTDDSVPAGARPLIFGAMKATQGVAETIKNRPVDTTMVFLKPPEPPKPPPEQPPPDVIVAANPPPKGFQTVVAPTDIPKTFRRSIWTRSRSIPRISPGKASRGARAPASRAAPAGLWRGLPGSAAGRPRPGISQPHPAIRQCWPAPGSPDAVEMQFIVDTTGHVEPPSFKVIKTTHPAFCEPAREAILKSVFKPAKFKGRPVAAGPAARLVQAAIASFPPGGITT